MTVWGCVEWLLNNCLDHETLTQPIKEEEEEEEEEEKILQRYTATKKGFLGHMQNQK